jgi:hypothetical protein
VGVEQKGCDEQDGGFELEEASGTGKHGFLYAIVSISLSGEAVLRLDRAKEEAATRAACFFDAGLNVMPEKADLRRSRACVRLRA